MQNDYMYIQKGKWWSKLSNRQSHIMQVRQKLCYCRGTMRCTTLL